MLKTDKLSDKRRNAPFSLIVDEGGGHVGLQTPACPCSYDFFLMKFRLYKAFSGDKKGHEPGKFGFRGIMNQLFLVFLLSVLLASSISIGSSAIACEQIHTSLCWGFTEGHEKTTWAEVHQRSPPLPPSPECRVMVED